jgi:hypothetical protein
LANSALLDADELNEMSLTYAMDPNNAGADSFRDVSSVSIGGGSRQRGRPMKQQQQQQHTSSVMNKLQPQSTTRRLTANTSIISSSSQQLSPSKRGRGRPPKKVKQIKTTTPIKKERTPERQSTRKLTVTPPAKNIVVMVPRTAKSRHNTSLPAEFYNTSTNRVTNTQKSVVLSNKQKLVSSSSTTINASLGDYERPKPPLPKLLTARLRDSIQQQQRTGSGSSSEEEE